MKLAAILFTISTLALAGSAPVRTFTGVITDSMCVKDHKSMNIAPDDNCVRECVKHGSKYVLFDGKNAYKLSDQETPGRFAAKKVNVTGTLFEKTGVIKVDTIEASR